MVEKKYLIGTVDLLGHDLERGAYYSISSKLLSHLRAANFSGVQVNVELENHRLAVYGTEQLTSALIGPVHNSIRSFNSHITSIRTAFNPAQIPLGQDLHAPQKGSTDLEGLASTYRGKMLQAEEKVRQLEQNYKQLEGTNEQIRQELTQKSQNEEQLRQILKDKDIMYRKSLDTISALQKNLLEESADPEKLAPTLSTNEKTYTAKQEAIIRGVFSKIAERVDARKVYEKSEEITEAIKRFSNVPATKEERNKLLATFESQATRKAVEREWSDLEKTVTKYEQERASLQTLQFPVRIADTGNAKYIVLPVKTDSKSELARAVEARLVDLGTQISGAYKEKVPFNLQRNTQFLTAELKGAIDSTTLENEVRAYFGSLTETAGLEVVPFRTPYFEYTAESPRREGLAVSASLPDFVRGRIRELGYKSVSELCRSSNGAVKTIFLRRLLGGKTKKHWRKNIKSLAEALQVDISEIDIRIK